MKQNTIKLLFWVAVLYSIVLFVARGFLPSDSIPTISLTAIPLIIMAVIIIRDLATRSTSPARTRNPPGPQRQEASEVQFISGQIRVTSKASTSYFDDVVRARLKELLINKVALESGLDTAEIREVLSDEKQGPNFLRDERLHRLLYSPAPERGKARVEMIREAVDRIEAWKA